MRVVSEGGQHTAAQELVLVMAPPWSIRRPALHLTTCNSFLWLELVSRQIDFGAIG